MKQICLRIDGREVSVAAGTTILAAAAGLGIEIPVLCHLKGVQEEARCMVCAVELAGGGVVPSCEAVAQEGMTVLTGSERAVAARRRAVEMLFSEHRGDCVAPCVLAHPDRFDIPKLMRFVAAGDFTAAAGMARAGVRGTFARTEQVCRRSLIDAPVAIGAVVEFAARLAGVTREPETAVSHPLTTGTLSKLGMIDVAEVMKLAETASGRGRVGDEACTRGLVEGEAVGEAERCLMCSCAALDTCRLKRLADVLGVDPNRYRGKRRPYDIDDTHAAIRIETGKCIGCGICVNLTRAGGEKYGLAFHGRGFGMRPGFPFDKTAAECLEKTALRIAEACPTGAITAKSGSKNSS